MEYQYQIVSEDKHSGRKAFLSAVIAAVLAAVIVGGLVFGYMKTQMDALTSSFETKLNEANDKVSKLETTTASALDELNQAIDNIGDGSSTTQQHITVVNSDGTSISDVAAEAIQSIVYISVYVPNYKTSSGFFYTESAATFSGSGVLYEEKDGKTYILTNYHVVEYVNEYKNVVVTVKLNDKTEYTASFVGGDSTNDLAVLSIEATSLKLAKIGDSDSLRVGDMAIAIGNPLGETFAGSVTVGYVSALNRNISSENTAETLIQTDAAINPGNSGGALFDILGNVIGITSSKIVSDDVEGLGFAIPINFALPIIHDLIEYGYVKDRPYTGILSGTQITSAMSRYYNLPIGLYLTELQEGGPAVLAGLKTQDIIVEIDGASVSSMTDIQTINSTHKVADTLTIKYYRNGSYKTTTLILGEDTGI